MGAVVFGLLTPLSWSGPAPTGNTLVLFLTLGVLAGLGHFMPTLSFRHVLAQGGGAVIAAAGIASVVTGGAAAGVSPSSAAGPPRPRP